LKPEKPRRTVTDARYAAGSKEASVQQSSEHRARPGMGRALAEHDR
jgi:hypothetical protein